MDEDLKLYVTVATGLSALMMLAEVAGAWICLAFRGLSAWFVLASAGFVGLIAANAVSHAATLLPKSWFGPLWVATSAASFASVVALVAGLGLGLAEVRRKLALAMEPPHVRR